MSLWLRTLCELGMSTIIRVDDANFTCPLSPMWYCFKVFQVPNHMIPTQVFGGVWQFMISIKSIGTAGQ